MNRREFLKSIGIVATSIAIPVSIEIAARPFTELQKVHKNYLIMQSPGKLVVAQVKALDLDMAQREKILPIVFHESFHTREIMDFVHHPARLELELYNGIPIKFEGGQKKQKETRIRLII